MQVCYIRWGLDHPNREQTAGQREVGTPHFVSLGEAWFPASQRPGVARLKVSAKKEAKVHKKKQTWTCWGGGGGRVEGQATSVLLASRSDGVWS